MMLRGPHLALERPPSPSAPSWQVAVTPCALGSCPYGRLSRMGLGFRKAMGTGQLPRGPSQATETKYQGPPPF